MAMGNRAGTWSSVLGAVLLAAVLGGPAAASAGASPGPPVGPHQLFAGFVNGRHWGATIDMACFGAIRPGQTGHPVAGQTFAVEREVDVPGGYTGTAADRIVAFFPPVPSTAPPGVVLRRYGLAEPIPTTLTLPCAGRGIVEFAPAPSRGGARADRVPVSFVGQP
jgi:hypothetical protein